MAGGYAPLRKHMQRILLRDRGWRVESATKVAGTLVLGKVTLVGLEEEEPGLEKVCLRVTRGETQ